MSNWKLKSVFVASALLLATAGSAHAQGTVGAGVSFLHSDGGTANGFTVDYSSVGGAKDKAAVGIVGDFGLSRDNGVTGTSYLGGVRVAIPGNEKVKPFAQFLLGAEHCCATTNFAWQPGAGVDIAINANLNVRAQVDFRRVRADGLDFNEQRYTFGVSVPLGGRK